MNDAIQHILDEEEKFARTVALGIAIQRPVTVWHYLIPGMFIFDFLNRQKAIRLYSRHFLTPRREALFAAAHIIDGKVREAVAEETKARIASWLDELKRNDDQLLAAQMRLVDILIDHYGKLLASSESAYAEMIRKAYRNRTVFQGCIDQITRAERRVDRALINCLGDSPILLRRLEAERTQVERRRKAMLDEIFNV